MSDALTLAKQIVAECYKGPFARYGSVHDWEQCIETHLTAALHAAEQRVWEEAAKDMKAKLRELPGYSKPIHEHIAYCEQKGQVGDE